MKVWPIDPLVPRNLRLEVPEKLPQVAYPSSQFFIMSQEYSLLLQDESQRTASDDGDYQHQPSSQHYGTPNLSQEPSYTPKDLFLLEVFNDWKSIGARYLDNLVAERYGWCGLVKLATNKGEADIPLEQRRGYIQLSFKGLNKVSHLILSSRCFHRIGRNQVILLHHLVAIASVGLAPDTEDDASHLCHHSTCKVVGHVCWESKQKNQDRKGCSVWVQCPHCPKKIWACEHKPRCIRAIPGVTEAQFLKDLVLYMH
jgi:hypothetical protein